MTKLEELIKELCPNGVEYVELQKVCNFNRGTSITSKEVKGGDVPVVSGGQQPAFYHNVANREANSITIAGSGAYAGYVSFWEEPIFCADSFTVDVKNKNKLDKRYLYYFLLNKQNYIYSRKQGVGIPHVHGKDIARLQIPLPPLAVQREIVRILDKFTLYSQELAAELAARKKQYEFYRDELLRFQESYVEWKTIDEIAYFRRGSFPQPYTNLLWYGGEGAMPFVQVADVAEDGMRLVEHTKQTISKIAQPKSVFVKEGTVIVSLQGSIGRVALTQYDTYVDRTLAIFYGYKIEIDKKYFAYQLVRKFDIEKESARGSTIKTITKEEFSKFQIPVPPLAEQKRIVAILDRFDTLCNDLSEGLPAEIERRQKQYEYFREKLLQFDKSL